MVFITVYAHSRYYFLYLSIDPGIYIAIAPDLFEQLPVMSLPSPYQGSQHINLLPRVSIHNDLQDLILRVLHHLFTGYIGKCIRCPGKKKPEKIIDLGDRTYS